MLSLLPTHSQSPPHPVACFPSSRRPHPRPRATATAAAAAAFRQGAPSSYPRRPFRCRCCCFSSSSSSSSPSAGGFRTRGASAVVEVAPRWPPGLLAAAVVVMLSCTSASALQEWPSPEDTTLANVPQTLSAGGDGGADGEAQEKKRRIQRPKSREAERCTVKCLGTCIRGGAGSPGEGPLNIRRPLVVFKPGFRSRNYCLVECSDICNLIRDGHDGP